MAVKKKTLKFAEVAQIMNFAKPTMPAENLQPVIPVHASDQMVQNYFRQHQSLNDVQWKSQSNN